MRPSKFEQFLMTDVGSLATHRVRRVFSSPVSAVKSTRKGLRDMFFDVDAFEEDDFDDNQLELLGLDVKKINGKEYWNYDGRNTRR